MTLLCPRRRPRDRWISRTGFNGNRLLKKTRVVSQWKVECDDRKETQGSQDSLNAILILAAWTLCALGMPSFMQLSREQGSEHSEKLYKQVGDFWHDQQPGPHPPEDSKSPTPPSHSITSLLSRPVGSPDSF